MANLGLPRVSGACLSARSGFGGQPGSRLRRCLSNPRLWTTPPPWPRAGRDLVEEKKAREEERFRSVKSLQLIQRRGLFRFWTSVVCGNILGSCRKRVPNRDGFLDAFGRASWGPPRSSVPSLRRGDTVSIRYDLTRQHLHNVEHITVPDSGRTGSSWIPICAYMGCLCLFVSFIWFLATNRPIRATGEVPVFQLGMRPLLMPTDSVSSSATPRPSRLITRLPGNPRRGSAWHQSLRRTQMVPYLGGTPSDIELCFLHAGQAFGLQTLLDKQDCSYVSSCEATRSGGRRLGRGGGSGVVSSFRRVPSKTVCWGNG